MEMGMVNQAWDAFEGWIDDAVEIVPSHEKDSRKNLADAKEKFKEATREKSDVEKSTCIEIRERNGEIKALKSELRKKKTIDNARREDLHHRLTLLESFVAESKAKEKRVKEKYQSCQLALSECKKN